MSPVEAGEKPREEDVTRRGVGGEALAVVRRLRELARLDPQPGIGRLRGSGRDARGAECEAERDRAGRKQPPPIRAPLVRVHQRVTAAFTRARKRSVSVFAECPVRRFSNARSANVISSITSSTIARRRPSLRWTTSRRCFASSS